jgi:hypothetical protein
MLYLNSNECCPDGDCPQTPCGECFSCEEYFPCVRYPDLPGGQLCSATLKKDANGNPFIEDIDGDLECAYILDCGFSPIDYVLRSMFAVSYDCCPYPYDDGEEYYVYTSWCNNAASWVDPTSSFYYPEYNSPLTLFWSQAECCFISADGYFKYCPGTDEYSEGGEVFVDPYADFWGTTSDSRITPSSAAGVWWEDVNSHRKVTDDGTLGGTKNVNINCL